MATKDTLKEINELLHFCGVQAENARRNRDATCNQKIIRNARQLDNIRARLGELTHHINQLDQRHLRRHQQKTLKVLGEARSRLSVLSNAQGDQIGTPEYARLMVACATALASLTTIYQ